MEEFTTRREEQDGIGAQSFVRHCETILPAISELLMPGTTFQVAKKGHFSISANFITPDGRQVFVLLVDCSNPLLLQPGDASVVPEGDQAKPEGC